MRGSSRPSSRQRTTIADRALGRAIHDHHRRALAHRERRPPKAPARGDRFGGRGGPAPELARRAPDRRGARTTGERAAAAPVPRRRGHLAVAEPGHAPGRDAVLGRRGHLRAPRPRAATDIDAFVAELRAGTLHRLQRHRPVQGGDGGAVRPPRGRRRVARRRQHHHRSRRTARRRDHRRGRFRAGAERASMWPRQGATALVLGAGGAAAAVALALTRVPLLRLRIAARRDAAAAEPRRTGFAAPATSRPSPGIATPSPPPRALRDRGQRHARSGWRRCRSTRDRFPPACSVVDLRYRPRPVDVVAAAHRDGPSSERRARDAPPAGIAELRDLDREGRARGAVRSALLRAVEA